MHARVGCVEASPSPVYGAALLMRFGVYPPSRVQIPPPPLLFVQAPVSTRPGPERFSGVRRVCAIWSLAGAGSGRAAGWCGRLAAGAIALPGDPVAAARPGDPVAGPSSATRRPAPRPAACSALGVGATWPHALRTPRRPAPALGVTCPRAARPGHPTGPPRITPVTPSPATSTEVRTRVGARAAPSAGPRADWPGGRRTHPRRRRRPDLPPLPPRPPLRRLPRPPPRPGSRPASFSTREPSSTTSASPRSSAPPSSASSGTAPTRARARPRKWLTSQSATNSASAKSTATPSPRKPARHRRRPPTPRLQAPDPPRLPRRTGPRPRITFGNLKADVLDRFEEGYTRPNFVRIIEGSPWPE